VGLAGWVEREEETKRHERIGKTALARAHIRKTVLLSGYIRKTALLNVFLLQVAFFLSSLCFYFLLD
jgi:hypothetical protein